MPEVDRVSLANEAEELVDALGQHLLALENRGVRRDELAECFRIVHTLKGLAVSNGDMMIAEVAHRVETLLDRGHDDLEFGAGALDLLYESAELFARALAYGHRPMPSDVVESLCNRLEAASLSSPALVSQKRAALTGIEPELLNVLTRRERRHLQEVIEDGRSIVRVELAWEPAALRSGIARLKQALPNVAELIALVPGPDAGANIRLDALIATSADAGTLNRIAKAAGARPIAISDALASSEKDDVVLVRSASRTVRVDIRKVDALLGAVGELSLLAAGVAGAVDDLRELGRLEAAAALENDIGRLEACVGHIQRGLIGVRMVTLGSLLGRLGRVARRVASSRAKLVSFTVSGAETEVDKVIVEELAEPLLHLVRNAIDHGIESPPIRATEGKPEQGSISIRARQEGSQLVVDLSDDGAGVDRSAILAAAVERGLCSRESAEAQSDREVLDFLFEPGFSTRATADLVSGRGIGLDAVRASIGRLGGVIGLTSEPGKGATFAIRVPITLAMVHAILVRIGTQVFAMPVSGVVESSEVQSVDLIGAEPHQRTVFRRQQLSVARVSNLLGIQEACGARQTVVVGGVGSSRIGLLVDEIAGAQDIVVKPLPTCLESVRGFAGAAELGGRKAILVLDVPSLLDLARHRQTAAGFPSGDLPADGSDGDLGLND